MENSQKRSGKEADDIYLRPGSLLPTVSLIYSKNFNLLAFNFCIYKMRIVIPIY